MTPPRVFVVDDWPSPKRSWKDIAPGHVPCDWNGDEHALVARQPATAAVNGHGIVLIHRSAFIERHCQEATPSACASSLTRMLVNSANQSADLQWVVISGDTQTDSSPHQRLYFRRTSVAISGADIDFSRCLRAFIRDTSQFGLIEPEPVDNLYNAFVGWSSAGDVEHVQSNDELADAKTQFARLCWRGDGDTPLTGAEIAWALAADWTTLVRADQARLRAIVQSVLDGAAQ